MPGTNRENPNQGRVYDKEGLAPTLNCMQGGNLQPMIIEDFYKNREPRVYEETAPTIRAEREGLKVIEDYIMPGNNFNQCNKVHPENGICRTIIGQGHAGNEPKVIVASRGRNPDNPSDRKQGIELEQRLEPNSEGICNTLTSVQKDNLVLEPKVVQAVGDRGNHSYSVKDTAFTIPANPMSDRGQMVLEPKLVGGLGEKDWGKQWRQGNRVYDSEAIAMALQAQPVGNAGGNSYLYKTDYRIRKLTPKECAKLMKFSDEDANKMLEVNSNTQVYKQCGNSIVVSVLEAIFCQMNIKGCPTWEERAKEEYL